MAYRPLLKISASTGVLLLALAGCQEIESFYKRIGDIVLLPEDRTPGEKLRVQPEEVWANENCSSRKLPFLRLDANEVSPATVRPGEKFNHRLVYTMCSDPRYGPIYGRIRTSIYYNSQKIYTDKATDFAVKDGSWIVDADVVVPYDASQARIGWKQSSRVLARASETGQVSSLNLDPGARRRSRRRC